MKIMFLTHYFPPEVNAPATRTYEHAKFWKEAGHDVTVVTCAPNHPKGEVYPGYRNRFYQKENVDGIEVIRVWTYLTANEGFIKRTMNYISYMLTVLLVAPFLPKPDIVISTSPQFFCGLAGFFVKLFKRVPWILEIRDLWPESIIAVGAIKSNVIIRTLEAIERWAYRSCDHIVVVTDAFKGFIQSKGIPPEKIEIIKNGVDLSFYDPEAIEIKEEIDERLKGKFIASYFGTHGMAHHLETVLEAADELRDRDDIVFLLVGEGAEKQRLSEMCERMALDNVVMLGQQSKDKMPILWSISDVSLVLLKKSDLFKTVIPSKIFESMAMKKPIILGVEGEVQGMIEEGGSGICIEPEDAKQLAAAVITLADDEQGAAAYGERGLIYVREYYDRRVLASRYVELIEEVLKRREVV